MMAVKWNGAEIEARVRKAVMIGVTRAANKIHKEAVRLIQEGPKTGKIYKTRGVEHQASAPGEAPANDTGRLVNSGIVTLNNKNLSARVSFATDYVMALEFGTPYKIKNNKGEDGGAMQREFGTQSIEPRPFLRPALASVQQEIQSIVDDEISKELKNSAIIFPKDQMDLF